MMSIPRFSSTTVSALGTLVVGLLLWVSGAFTLIQGWGGHSAPVKIAILVAAFVVQLAAPRRPSAALAIMVVLIALDLPSGASLPLWISFTDVIFAVMTVGSARLRRFVGVACFAVTVAGAVAVALAADPRAGVLVGLLGVAFLVSPLGYAQSVHATIRAARAEQSAAAAEHAAALAEERRRVSRELHDTVAGHVSAIAILAEAAREAPDPKPVIASMRSNSLAALSELREMIDVLAADGDDTPTVRWSSLAPFVTAAEAVGSAVEVHGDTEGLPLAIETVLTRIAGEALANATRHEPGQPVAVQLVSAGEIVEMTVSNGLTDGRAMARGEGDGSGGNGLRNMMIRAESIGGSATAGVEGRRWVVRVRVPVVRA
ncbi:MULTISPECIES: sensor histidine kinase [Gordonia]|uniref:histidine kinase n=1 Tax=Gordonia sihwensis NBRC 108236 TaxID=1223544 RepID=L7LH54_9ACTN|nr:MULTISPECIES: histidine kinase [Gordonia]AUH68352.1 histidine kinase [Gordonia sp. YC-JH1]GAC60440.1 putative two-component histidine kinase [Gordonia sihwensis NBRC 108236]